MSEYIIKTGEKAYLIRNGEIEEAEICYAYLEKTAMGSKTIIKIEDKYHIVQELFACDLENILFYTKESAEEALKREA